MHPTFFQDLVAQGVYIYIYYSKLEPSHGDPSWDGSKIIFIGSASTSAPI